MLKIKSIIIIIALLVITLNCTKENSSQMNPKEDCENLLSNLMPFAEKMLNQHGEFYPFGMVIENSNKITSIATHDGNEKPLSNDVIKELTSIMKNRSANKEIIASGIAYDVKVNLPEQPDYKSAVCISLEHKNNYSVIVLYPYKSDKNHKIEFIDPIAQKGKKEIFE